MSSAEQIYLIGVLGAFGLFAFTLAALCWSEAKAKRAGRPPYVQQDTAPPLRTAA